MKMKIVEPFCTAKISAEFFLEKNMAKKTGRSEEKTEVVRLVIQCAFRYFELLYIFRLNGRIRLTQGKVTRFSSR